MEEFLNNLIKEKETQMNELRAAIKKSESVTEVRSMTAQLENLKNEVTAAQVQLDNLDNNSGSGGDFDPTQARSMFTFSNNRFVEGYEEDVTCSTEYRSAFMQYVTRNAPIPQELRNQNTLTNDVDAAIPTHLVNRIIQKAESIGMILPRVSKSHLPFGISIPKGNVKPVATWVNEGQGSKRQKATLGSISFTKHKLRCEISMSMETSVMAIGAFEDAFVQGVANAMVIAKEKAILHGDGDGKPKGILSETPAKGQAVMLAADEKISYKTLIKLEAAVPQAYENNVVYCMTKKTFMAFEGMTDDNGQPIARVNYGIKGKKEYYLLGREVIPCGDYMSDYNDTVTSDATVLFLFNFKDYLLNTVYDMGIQRKQDWDTEDMLTKAVESCDGQVLDKNSLVTLTKLATKAAK